MWVCILMNLCGFLRMMTSRSNPSDQLFWETENELSSHGEALTTTKQVWNKTQLFLLYGFDNSQVWDDSPRYSRRRPRYEDCARSHQAENFVRIFLQLSMGNHNSVYVQTPINLYMTPKANDPQGKGCFGEVAKPIWFAKKGNYGGAVEPTWVFGVNASNVENGCEEWFNPNDFEHPRDSSINC